MRILAKPLDTGTKLEVHICLYGKKNADDTVPMIEHVEIMSNKEWADFKRLSDKRKLELIKRVGTSRNTEEILIGNSPLLDDAGKTAKPYEHDYEEVDGQFQWAV